MNGRTRARKPSWKHKVLLIGECPGIEEKLAALKGAPKLERVACGYEAFLRLDSYPYLAAVLDTRVSSPEISRIARRLKKMDSTLDLFLIVDREGELEIFPALEFGVKGILNAPLSTQAFIKFAKELHLRIRSLSA